MCPENPLQFLEEKIKEMLEKGHHSLLWYYCNVINNTTSKRTSALGHLHRAVFSLQREKIRFAQLPCSEHTPSSGVQSDANAKYCCVKVTKDRQLESYIKFLMQFFNPIGGGGGGGVLEIEKQCQIGEGRTLLFLYFIRDYMR